MGKSFILIFVGVLSVLLCFQGQLIAGGFNVPHQTARGLALSNAVTAGIDDPSAVYYNPAALGEIEGNQILVSGAYLNVLGSVENSGRTAVNKRDDNFFATAFANYRIPNTDLTLGFGAYAPYGLATTYERDFTRFAAERAELKTLFVTPSLSWKPSKIISLGAGVSLVHSSAQLSRSLCFDIFTGCPTTESPLEGRIRITDTANAFTYNIGVLLRPLEQVKFGFSYRARTDLRFDSGNVKLGGAFVPNASRANIRPISLPPVINAGVSWQVNPVWAIELDYEYVRWSEFKSLKASFSPPPTFVPFGIPLTSFNLPQDWNNTNTLRLGVSYKMNDSWELRGGLGLDETAIPNRTLNPVIFGADALTLNAGASYKWSAFVFDLGYQAAFYKTRKVNNDELEGLPATGVPFVGAPGPDTHKTFVNFLMLSLGYRF